jgi:hypothetical protein
VLRNRRFGTWLRDANGDQDSRGLVLRQASGRRMQWSDAHQLRRRARRAAFLRDFYAD